MARRVKTAVGVEPVEIELADGTVYRFALDMAAVAALEDEHENALQYLQDLLGRFEKRPASTMTELIYVGIRASHPGVTLDQLRRNLPVSLDLMNAITDALSDSLPGDTERPTIPGLWAAMNTVPGNGSTTRIISPAPNGI